MKKESLLLITAFVGLMATAMLFIPKHSKIADHVLPATDSASSITQPVLEEVHRKIVEFDTLSLINIRNTRLIDFQYESQEYTSEQIDSRWYRREHPLAIDSTYSTVSTIHITVGGNLGGGQPMNGNILLQSDTVYLMAWHVNTQPPRMSYHKVKLEYAILTNHLPSDLVFIPMLLSIE